ncbi:CHAT domain-containing protein [Kineococcus sp. SYSU DK005]|uniref:CHAT domain-containing protein n=1 Tax=Kineococcus sp. SYSU DK005 TaxID=3383126 RepID=UPI003D7CAD66
MTREDVLQRAVSAWLSFNSSGNAHEYLSEQNVADVQFLIANTASPANDLQFLQIVGTYNYCIYLINRSLAPLEEAVNILSIPYMHEQRNVPEALREHVQKYCQILHLRQGTWSDFGQQCVEQVKPDDTLGIDLALTVTQRALQLETNRPTITARNHFNTGLMLRSRYVDMHHPQDAEASIRHLRASASAVRATVPEGAATAMREMSIVVNARATHIGGQTHALEALRCAEELQTIVTESNLVAFEYLADAQFAEALLLQAKASLMLEDAHQSASYVSILLEKVPTTSTARLPCLNTFIKARLHQNAIDQNDLHLEQIIDAIRECLAKEVDKQELGRHAVELQTLLLAQFRHTGDVGLLNECIHAVLEHAPNISARRDRFVVAWGRMCFALVERFRVTRRFFDLKESERLSAPLENMANSLPEFDAAEFCTLLSIRADILASVAAATVEDDDLDSAIEFARKALDSAPSSIFADSELRARLADALLASNERSANVTFLGEAIELLKSALEEADGDREVMSMRQLRYARALIGRYRLNGDLADLGNAITFAQEALSGTDLSHRQQACLVHLGDYYWLRYGRCGDGEDALKAIEAAKAASMLTTSPAAKAAAAQSWGLRCAQQGHWGAAVEAFKATGEYARTALGRGMGDADQHQMLRSLNSHASWGTLAAACALAESDAAGDPSPSVATLEKSVILWEQGRAFFVRGLLEGHADLSELRLKHPELADEYEDLMKATDAANLKLAREGARTNIDGDKVNVEFTSDPRLHINEILTEVVQKIQSMPGFEHFPGMDMNGFIPTLRAGEAAIIVNICDIRSDAIILTPEGLTSVQLATVASSEVSRLNSRFFSSLDVCGSGASSARERAQAESAIEEVLEWLWINLAEPVMAKLEERVGVQPDTHVYWCLSGLLSRLPIHAAGLRQNSSGSRSSVASRCVSSCVTSFSTWQRARALQRQDTFHLKNDEATLAVIAMPSTPGANDLPGVHDEVRSLRNLFRGNVEVHLDPVPMKQTAADVLDHYPLVHFACHGFTDTSNPSESLLLLGDWKENPLTVTEIARMQASSPANVFLSACSTAKSDSNLPDESLHIAAAMQVAGFPSVVGTLWEVDDDASALLASEFYSALLESSGESRSANPARALHSALAELKKYYRRYPSIWCAYTHYGT